MSKNEDQGKAIFVMMCVSAVIGALIGFGSEGTLQGTCLGAGIGAIVPVLFLTLP